MTVALAPGWAASIEQRPELPTRESPIKWVILADRELPRGLQINAAVCLAAAVGKAAPAVIGSGGPDASGGRHAGLPWIGCAILAATAPIIRQVRGAALAEPDLLVTDMADIARGTRVYADYLARLAATKDEDLTYQALSIAGPRPLVDRHTGRFPLLR